MYQTKEQYREHLEELSYEELLGEEFLESEAKYEIESRLDAIQDELESMDYEELLGEEYLEELAEKEIERRVEAYEESGE